MTKPKWEVGDYVTWRYVKGSRYGGTITSIDRADDREPPVYIIDGKRRVAEWLIAFE